MLSWGGGDWGRERGFLRTGSGLFVACCSPDEHPPAVMPNPLIGFSVAWNESGRFSLWRTQRREAEALEKMGATKNVLMDTMAIVVNDVAAQDRRNLTLYVPLNQLSCVAVFHLCLH